jgi:hypothetical protein
LQGLPLKVGKRLRLEIFPENWLRAKKVKSKNVSWFQEIWKLTRGTQRTYNVYRSVEVEETGYLGDQTPEDILEDERFTPKERIYFASINPGLSRRNLRSYRFF